METGSTEMDNLAFARMQLSRLARCTAALLLLASIIVRANASDEVAPASASPSLTLPADTEIHLRLLETVASNTHKRGDRFKLDVAEMVTVGDSLIIPAGSPAEGEVVHAAKPGMAGRAGELILAVRFLRAGDQRVKLRSFTAGTGENRLNLATGLSMSLGIPGLFVVGKNIVVPAGTDVFAKVAAATPLTSVLEMGAADVLPAISVELPTETGDDKIQQ